MRASTLLLIAGTGLAGRSATDASFDVDVESVSDVRFESVLVDERDHPLSIVPDWGPCGPS